jgi:hypothetical protein
MSPVSRSVPCGCVVIFFDCGRVLLGNRAAKKTVRKVTVYTRHQGLKQASHSTKNKKSTCRRGRNRRSRHPLRRPPRGPRHPPPRPPRPQACRPSPWALAGLSAVPAVGSAARRVVVSLCAQQRNTNITPENVHSMTIYSDRNRRMIHKRAVAKHAGTVEGDHRLRPGVPPACNQCSSTYASGDGSHPGHATQGSNSATGI